MNLTTSVIRMAQDAATSGDSNGAAKDFFTRASLATFAGATGAIYVVTNTVRILTKIASPIVPFVISVVVAVVAAKIAEVLDGPGDYFLAFLNACLLFCTAVGTQEIVGGSGVVRRMTFQRQPGLGWRGSWVRQG